MYMHVIACIHSGNYKDKELDVNRIQYYGNTHASDIMTYLVASFLILNLAIKE